jgi:hypothetical protein
MSRVVKLAELTKPQATGRVDPARHNLARAIQDQQLAKASGRCKRCGRTRKGFH